MASKKDLKYNTLIIEAIVNTIVVTGNEKDACKQAGVPFNRYKKWLNSKPRFKEKIDQAFLSFQRNLPNSLRAKALDGLQRHLTTYKKKKVVTKYEFCKDQETGKRVKIAKEGEDIIEDILPPQWAIKLALDLGVNQKWDVLFDDLEAIETLLDSSVITEDLQQMVAHKLKESNDEIKQLLTQYLKNEEKEQVD